MAITVGGIDTAFPNDPGRYGDIVWQGKNNEYVADFYVYDVAGANTFYQYYNKPVIFYSNNQKIDFQGGYTRFSNFVGVNRDNPGYEVDVFGTVNARSILVNGAPITSGGGASFDKANTANIAAKFAYDTANLAYGQGNTAYTQANTAYNKANSANLLAYYASINATAAFVQSNTAYTVANSAYDKANTANVLATLSYNASNAAFNKANTWLLSGNVAPTSAVANSFWFNTDTAELYVYFIDWDGTSQWVQINGSLGGGNALKDVGYYSMFFYPGYVDTNVTMYMNNTPVKYYLPANLTGSYATVETAPSGNNANLRISKNGTYIGNIAFARNSTNGTFVFANTVQFDPGDKLKIVSPPIVDPTMADIAISLVGIKLA